MFLAALTTAAVHFVHDSRGVVAALSTHLDEGETKVTSGFRCLVAGLSLAADLQRGDYPLTDPEITDPKTKAEWQVLERMKRIVPLVQVITRLGSDNRKAARKRKTSSDSGGRWKRATTTRGGLSIDKSGSTEPPTIEHVRAAGWWHRMPPC